MCGEVDGVRLCSPLVPVPAQRVMSVQRDHGQEPRWGQLCFTCKKKDDIIYVVRTIIIRPPTSFPNLHRHRRALTSERAVRECFLLLYTLLWSKAHLKWTETKWETVLRSDGSEPEIRFRRCVLQTTEGLHIWKGSINADRYNRF